VRSGGIISTSTHPIICGAGYLQFMGRDNVLAVGNFSNLYAQIESN